MTKQVSLKEYCAKFPTSQHCYNYEFPASQALPAAETGDMDDISSFYGEIMSKLGDLSEALTTGTNELSTFVSHKIQEPWGRNDLISAAMVGALTLSLGLVFWSLRPYWMRFANIYTILFIVGILSMVLFMMEAGTPVLVMNHVLALLLCTIGVLVYRIYLSLP